MKATKTSVMLLILLSICECTIAQEKYSTVKIYPPDDNLKRSELIGLLQLDHFYYEADGGFVAEINQADIKRLQGTGYQYKIVVPDVAKNLQELNRAYYAKKADNNRVAFEQTGNTVSNLIATPSAFVVQPTFGGYYSFAQMEAAMGTLATTYPAIVQRTSLGLTGEGRNIWCIKISDNVTTPNDATEPDLLYVGLQHAREAITGASMIFFMQYLAEQYTAGNTRIIELVNNREFYIIPCMNPDGWEYNRTNGGVGTGQRKNRRNVGTDNAGMGYQKGVDLNRNWGVDWADCNAPIQGSPTSCGSGDPNISTYWGTGAFSEPETNAIRSLVISKNFVVAFDQHAFGPYYSLPFGRRSLHTMTTQQQQYYSYIPALMGQYNGMRANDSYGALGYEVAGGFKDWMLLGDIGTGSKGTVYGMTGEGGAGGGTGGANGSFWAPASEIVNLSKGMCYQNLQLAYSAGSYVELQDVSDIALSSLSGNLNFSIKRIGLANAPVTITLIPIQNITSVGAPVTVNSLPNYYDVYNGSISYTLPAGMNNGHRLKFAWRVQTGGYTYYDTVVKFFNPVQLLYDDMEGSFATNWTNTAVATPSGFGYDYIAGNWVFTASGGYAGSTKALSESAAGTDYSTRSNRICQYNSTFSLTGSTAAYLSFWVRHRAENFRDRCVIQVSANGGPWQAVAGTTTIQEPGILDGNTINGIPSLTGIRDNWTRELFDLSAYNGTSSLRLRFNFMSDNDPSTFADERDDGFYIDNVKVIESNTPMITLPVEFIDFSGKLTPANTVELQWKAITDDKHSHFIAERSVDGQNFIAMGRVDGLPYRITDHSPAIGLNYYRIRQYDIDGNFSFSKTINISYDPSRIAISMYPNPAKENITLRFNATHSEKITIQVSDLTGKTIYSTQTVMGVVAQETKINVQSWASQTYIVKIVGDNNVALSVLKFVKQ